MGHKTIREIAVVWKDSKRPFVKQSTMAAYVLILENHILPTFGECDSLHEKIVQDYVLRKIRKGYFNRPKNGDEVRYEKRVDGLL